MNINVDDYIITTIINNYNDNKYDNDDHDDFESL